MLDKILGIVLFIIAFAALICIHEAGHLSMAKLFNVYCKEYSIGFGPAIYSKKRKGHETTFSVRWVPLGGYVAMYGEDGAEEDTDFKDIPVERSLDGIKKWKKAIVVAAGVVLNAILAFILIFISNFAFPVIGFTRNSIVQENSIAYQAGIREDDQIIYKLPDENKISPFQYEYTGEKKKIKSDIFFIVDNKVEIEEKKYVLVFYFNGDKKAPSLTDGLQVYPGLTKDQLATKQHSNELFGEWSKTLTDDVYYPDIDVGPKSFEKDTAFTAKITMKTGEIETPREVPLEIKVTPKGRKYINEFKDIGLSFKTRKVDVSAKDKWTYTFQDYGRASSAVFKGIKVLFTGGFANLSGVVGILDTSTTVLANYTFATYLYFWGLISVNLAIFNLLPFPGLDGWQLLVTVVEGVSHRRINSKFKTIMSLIGLFLLIGLMVVILILDILRGMMII